ncbi:cobalamin biosynthesis protein CobD [Ammoniphilus oxalaticus]|uniref:Cobalamin biosynthesis protein CobD n=1 Tax=Ammoniphilus oxalaticus TaxID=66863 RepID=A0A419SM49_9BACL|nr:cobalamin biosynthesis protein CobD [Ammoniphilus oxalaticus]
MGTAANAGGGLTFALGGLIAAFVIDWYVGDPRRLPHPVVGIGKMIVAVEKGLRALVTSPRMLKWAGVGLVVVIVGGSYALVWGLLWAAAYFGHQLFAWLVAVWLISTTMATKGLSDGGMDIYRKLAAGDLVSSRAALAMVVGRDTDRLDEAEISRGAVETVAENIVDAIISPLFYAALGGAPLAMAYRAVNTLDSMVGYKNERYEHFGWAAARFDDLANYVPARLTGMLLVAVCYAFGWNGQACLRVMRRDAGLHPSPNSGITEAGVAGALGIALGGTNFYQGIPSQRAKMGDPLRPIKAEDILKTVRIMKLVALAGLVMCVLLALIVHLVV